MYSATEDHDVKTHQLHDKDGGRIRYKKVCEDCGEAVEFGDLISAEEFVYKCVPPGDKPPAISTVGREFGRRPDILALEQVRMSNGKQIRLFAFRNIERWRKATPKQIREHYESTRKLNDPAIAAIKAGAKKLHDK
jgi:hypothetical protein